MQESKERIRDILLSFPDGLRMSSLEDHYQVRPHTHNTQRPATYSLGSFLMDLSELDKKKRLESFLFILCARRRRSCLH